ncbi:MAG: phosphatidylglycerophosphatase A [Phycisphaeraceae bacterium]|nr:phosphatidylglycerophosphatase A [Phycisphaeraceae bacterium]
MPTSSKLLWITTFGLGHMRPASGTWGSLPTVVLAGGLIYFGCGPAQSPVIFNAALIAWCIIFSMGCLIQGVAAEAKFGKKDPSQAVADETAGQAIACLFLPAAIEQSTFTALLALSGAFLAFRIFDILKIWPARGLQRLPGGAGILVDDLVAGVQALLVVQLIARILLR